MRKIPIITILTIMLAAGCAWMPRADLAQYSSQKRVLSAEHWGELATEVAFELDQAYLRPRKVKSVYINPGRTDSAFEKAYERYLAQALIKKGYVVSKAPGDSTVVNFDVETFLYSEKTKERWAFSKETIWATIFALSDEVITEITTKDLFDVTLVSVSAIYDLLSKKNQITDAEVLITTNIQSFYQIEYLAADEFYINRNDFMLYWSDKAPIAPRLQGHQTNVTLDLVNMRIVP